jgi:hypothetical protein
MRWLLTFLLLASSSRHEATIPEALLLGDWCAGSATAFHEEFSLSIEEGKHLFSSWLHQRPAESGEWKLEERTLTIHGRSGTDYVYRIEKASAKQLVLREGTEARETYVREGCRKFEAPPTD